MLGGLHRDNRSDGRHATRGVTSEGGVVGAAARRDCSDQTASCSACPSGGGVVDAWSAGNLAVMAEYPTPQVVTELGLPGPHPNYVEGGECYP